MSHAFIALGANLGDPKAAILAAFDALNTLPDSRLLARSSLYRTAPIGYADQPEFINAVAEIETGLSPEHLLQALLTLEQHFGRHRAEKNGPRTLDLDLLLYDQQSRCTPALTLPHPRLHLRAFVLCPLLELAPTLTVPTRGLLSAWLPAVSGQGIERLDA